MVINNNENRFDPPSIPDMGHCLNHLDKPAFMKAPEPLLTEFGIYRGLVSCVQISAGGKSAMRGKSANL